VFSVLWYKDIFNFILTKLVSLKHFICSWYHIFFVFIMFRIFPIFIDKQQELDLPSLRIDEADAAAGAAKCTVPTEASKKREKAHQAQQELIQQQRVTPTVGHPMSHITGARKPLAHGNSLNLDKIPKYAVESPNEEELGLVRNTILQSCTTCIGNILLAKVN